MILVFQIEFMNVNIVGNTQKRRKNEQCIFSFSRKYRNEFLLMTSYESIFFLDYARFNVDRFEVCYCNGCIL